MHLSRAKEAQRGFTLRKLLSSVPAHSRLSPAPQVFDLNEIEEHGLRTGGGGDDEGDGQGEALGQAAPTPALGLMKLSSDQRMLACTIDVDGSDRFVLAVFDLLGGGRGAQGRGSGSAPQQGPPTGVSVLTEDAM